MHKHLGIYLAAALLPAGLALAQPAATPWMNTALTADQRADLVAAQMTPAEKFVLINGWFGVDATINPNYPPPPADIRKALPGTAGYIPGIPRLGIPAQIETDASLGVANGGHMRPGDTATALPASILTASSWNPQLAYEVGAVLGRETRAKGFNVLLNGGVDLARDPRNGRNFEYTGEDPLLAGTIAGEAIRGAQDQNIISTAKHYAVNDQEIGRDWLSSNLDEKAMRESDLLAFEIAIERGDPGSIMCAYNRVNAVYSCENAFLLNKVLKGNWHYPGYVMSDWGGVHSTVDAAVNGLDQESAYVFDSDHFFDDKLKQAVADGKVPQSRIDDMVHRILRSMFAKGLFDHAAAKTPLDEKGDLAVAQRAAEEGIVLLKNTGNLLPLHARRIAVIGGRADVGVLSGGGSSQVIPLGSDPSTQEFPMSRAITEAPDQRQHLNFDATVYDPPSPVSALRAEAKGAKVVFDDGVDLTKAAALAKASDVAIVFVEVRQGEGWDLLTIALPEVQNALIAAVAKANPHTIVVLETGNPVAMPWLADVSAVVEAWYPGNRGAAALARVLTGKVNPSGRLPISFPQSDAQLPRTVIPGKDLVPPQNRAEKSFDVNYSEGANVGYKWYATQKLQPLFPFGHGLSYTTFAFDKLIYAEDTHHDMGVGFDVRNTGKRAGKTIAQIYATPPGGVMRLVGFAKVELKPGETKHVDLEFDPRLFASFDSAAQVWRVAGGDYVLQLGASSADISTTLAIHLDAATIKP